MKDDSLVTWRMKIVSLTPRYKATRSDTLRESKWHRSRRECLAELAKGAK